MIESAAKTICVFCSADDKVPNEYKQAAHDLGVQLAKNGFALLSGGNNSGLMNEVNNGHFIGDPSLPRHAVIPNIMRELSLNHPHIPAENVTWTEDVYARLKKFYDMCHHVVILPGGYGTMHELMDCLVLSQFGVIKKRIVLLNIDNFWDGIIQQFNTMVRKRTLYNKHLEHLIVAANITEAIDHLQSNIELELTQGFADNHWRNNSEN